MARIKIRGRQEYIEIENDRAKKLKLLKFGDDTHPAAAPTELVDLGDWSGELGRVVEIEMTKKDDSEARRREEEAEKQRKEKEEAERWLKLPAEEKAKPATMFETIYCLRTTGQFRGEVPADIAKKAYEIRVAWFKKNPSSTHCPQSEYPADILPPKKGTMPSNPVEALTKSMSVGDPKEVRLCKCGKELTRMQRAFCSGKCMLEAKNGGLSTE